MGFLIFFFLIMNAQYGWRDVGENPLLFDSTLQQERLAAIAADECVRPPE